MLGIPNLGNTIHSIHNLAHYVRNFEQNNRNIEQMFVNSNCFRSLNITNKVFKVMST